MRMTRAYPRGRTRDKGGAMGEIHVPLTRGLHEEIDAKLLPNGALSVAKDCRFRKDGRLAPRYGYAAISGAPTGVFASEAAGPNEMLAFTARADQVTPSTCSLRQATGTYASAAATKTLGDLGYVRRFALNRNTAKYVTSAGSCTLTSGGNVWHVTSEFTSTSNTDLVTVYETDPVSGALLWSTSFTVVNGSARTAVRIAATSAAVFVYYSDGADHTIKCLVVTASTHATATTTIGTPASATTCVDFDACGRNGTTTMVAYRKDATTISVGTVDVAGAYTEVQTQTGTAPASLGLAYKTNSDQACLVWFDTNAYYRRLTVGTATWSMSAYSFGSASGCLAPLVGADTNANEFAIFMNIYTGAAPLYTWGYRTGVGAIPARKGVFAICKPFTLGLGCYVWVADKVPTTMASAPNTAYLLDAGSVSASPRYEARAADLEVSATNSGFSYDMRRSVAVVASTDTPSQSDAYAVVSIFSGKGLGVDVLRVSLGAWIPRMQSAHINGETLFAGPMPQRFDGSELVEDGLYDGPWQVAAAGGAAGNVDVGTHLYAMTWEWYDAMGRIHRSPPSLPSSGASVTIASSAKQVTVTATGPIASDKNGVTANIWRTEAGKLVYYLVNSTENIAAGDNSTAVSYVDNITDATLTDGTHPVLYTQGARGAISGLLPNDPPPACRFIWAGADRCIIGGLEDPTAVQWSKLVYTGEALSWSISPAYRANVDGEVTGVAEMDGAWIIFTRDSVWTVVGAGPDDSGSGGYFDAPRRLPANVGCISARSIALVGAGLIFQGTNGFFWMLPRGGTDPQPIGQPVRDTLVTYPNVMDVQSVPAETCVYWLCLNAARNASVMVVYDTRIGEWYVDTVSGAPKCLALYNGTLVYAGAFGQTLTTWGDQLSGGPPTAITWEIQTGDIRPFGAAGWGRLNLFEILGEYRSGATITAWVSYDSGQTWTDSYAWNVGGLTAGDAVSRQFGPSSIQGVSYRVKIQAVGASGGFYTGEGLILHALSAQVFPAAGLGRRSAAERK